MKVIFLDFDGVINSAEFMKIRHRDRKIKNIELNAGKDEESKFNWYISMISEEHVKRLNQIIEATGAKVVVSSTWRILHDVEELSAFLKARGFIGEVIDRTPRFGGAPRGEEITDWLENNKVDEFVILDDDSDMCHLKHKLVHTSWQTGLQPEHVAMAIEMLRGKNESE